MDELIHDEAFDRQLREAVPYIEDAGFTARVLKQLPAARRAPQRTRAFILLGMSVLASVLAYFLSDGGRFVLVEMTRLSALPPLWLFVVALSTGLLVMAGGLVAAISRPSQLQP